MQFHFTLIVLAMASLFAFERCDAADAPNIVYVLADDLGFGDLGCYGQSTLKTPNIDRMAREGLRFTRHYAGSTVCAPSRCVLMTGLHTGHCRIRGNGPGQLTKDDVTFASVLREAGYRTGCFGKWGIGNPPPLDDPQRHGFDEFYGYINMFHAHNYYPEFLVRDGKKVPLRNRLWPHWKEQETPEREGRGVAEVAIDYAPQLIADDALRFIRENHDRRFFLYYALNIPHANNEGGREEFVDRNGMRVPRHGTHAGRGWPAPEKGFARMIDYIDRDMGNITKLLRELGIAKNTIVMFSSDNGPHQEGGHKVDFFDSNGPLRGHKRDLYDGGVRVPMLAWWPGTINSGVCDHISGFQDVFPTVAELAGVDGEIPKTDGISFAPTLLGNPDLQKKHDYLYWEFSEQGGKLGVLKGDLKAVRRNTVKNPSSPIEVYDLSKDLEEQNDIADNQPEFVAEAKRMMQAAHVEPTE